jgi:hypothetical protein
MTGKRSPGASGAVHIGRPGAKDIDVYKQRNPTTWRQPARLQDTANGVPGVLSVLWTIVSPVQLAMHGRMDGGLIGFCFCLCLFFLFKGHVPNI